MTAIKAQRLSWLCRITIGVNDASLVRQQCFDTLSEGGVI
jgi:uncharacterized membrane protein